MIKLIAYLEDKKAGNILHALEGLVVQMTMVPVRNAVTKGNKVVANGQPESAAQVVRAFVANAVNHKEKQVFTKDLVVHAGTYKFSKAAIMAAVSALKADGTLKQGKRGSYRIIGVK